MKEKKTQPTKNTNYTQLKKNEITKKKKKSCPV